jgi:hypothetical protein
MKKLLLAFALSASVHAVAAPAAKPVDPLWAKAVAQVNTMKKWIPEDFDMDVEVNDGDEVTKTKSRSHLTSWEKGKPNYVVKEISSSKPGKPKDGNLKIDSFTSMAEQIVKEDAPVKRSDNQPLGGKKWTVFQLTESQTGVKIDTKVWVDPQSGALHHMDTVINVPLLADIAMSTAYGDNAEIGVVPKASDISVEIRIPFKSGAKIHMLNTPLNWIKRPVQ